MVFLGSSSTKKTFFGTLKWSDLTAQGFDDFLFGQFTALSFTYDCGHRFAVIMVQQPDYRGFDHAFRITSLRAQGGGSQ